MQMKYLFLACLIFVIKASYSLDIDNKQSTVDSSNNIKYDIINIGESNTINFKSEKAASNSCIIYSTNTMYNKVGFHLKNFNNIKNILISDTKPIDCNTCDSKSQLCQISGINSQIKNQYVNFFWRLCLNNIFIAVQPDSQNTPDKADETGVVPSSFKIDSTLYADSPCIVKQETHLSYCGESKLDDCRKCKRRGCSIVECGNISNNRFVRHYM